MKTQPKKKKKKTYVEGILLMLPASWHKHMECLECVPLSHTLPVTLVNCLSAFDKNAHKLHVLDWSDLFNIFTVVYSVGYFPYYSIGL